MAPRQVKDKDELASELTPTLLTRSEKATVKRAAYLSDQSVSAFIRAVTVKAANKVVATALKAAA
ncbi:nikA [Caudoviricetes sp.]|nr:nikA [Caudoviricetes sp.]